MRFKSSAISLNNFPSKSIDNGGDEPRNYTHCATCRTQVPSKIKRPVALTLQIDKNTAFAQTPTCACKTLHRRKQVCARLWLHNSKTVLCRKTAVELRDCSVRVPLASFFLVVRWWFSNLRDIHRSCFFCELWGPRARFSRHYHPAPMPPGGITAPLANGALRQHLPACQQAVLSLPLAQSGCFQVQGPLPQ